MQDTRNLLDNDDEAALAAEQWIAQAERAEAERLDDAVEEIECKGDIAPLSWRR